MKHSFSVIIAMSLVGLIVLVVSGGVKATYYENVNVPGATTVNSGGYYGAVPGAINAGDFLYANETATLGGLLNPPGYGYSTQWIQTQGFTTGVWNNQYHTARDISLPPNTANIFLVYLDIRWQDPNPIWGGDGATEIPDYKAGFSLDAGSTWTWTALHQARIADGSPADDARDSINITALKTWTPQILKSINFCVKLIAYTYETIPLVYYDLDYVGVFYLWSGPDAPEEEQIIPGDEPGELVLPDVIGVIGITGFIGMIATPPAAVWFYRKNGGSKIYFGVMALVTFTVCSGFFLASINGG